ncbi:PaaI family thioesterase [Neobacillus niacini]|uniref:PaaI family thioesterase n=1 Tax=Neobacillus niacini TaxID=86668 RepID=UPI0007ABDD6B|nr:PaaI family thioesterase [Neobacillus niacini]MEC1520464.1 PaaI family thioesterase [Neobacillus niacini]
MKLETQYIKNPFDHLLNCKYEKISDTNLKVILPVQPLLLNTVGYVQGGIISLLADLAMGNACNAFDEDENSLQSVVTVDLKTTYLKGAKGDFLTADAHLIKKGRTLNHLYCNIYNDQDELVANAAGIFANLE